MKILHQNKWDRPGNNCLLDDEITLIEECNQVFLRHIHNYDGSWCGKGKDTYELDLDITDIDEAQDVLDEYLAQHFIDEMGFNLNEYIRSEIANEDNANNTN